jgi:magnesium chelatase accessory protein
MTDHPASNLPVDIPADWPHRSAGSIIASAPHRWHVQVMGRGPDLLLLHGAGASAHSFRGLISLLAESHRVIVPDLPGHGWTRVGRRGRAGVDAMAQDLTALCDAQGWRPVAVVGHSAGAALGLRMAQDRPVPVIGINAALGAFDGMAGWLFPILAKTLTYAPFVPQIFARLSGTTARVTALLVSTGSPLDATGVEMYRRLVARPDHVTGALNMMAEWQLGPLLAGLPALTSPVLLITSDLDRAVPAAVSEEVAAQMPTARAQSIQGFGHLVHEEAPDRVAAIILAFLKGH